MNKTQKNTKATGISSTASASAVVAASEPEPALHTQSAPGSSRAQEKVATVNTVRRNESKQFLESVSECLTKGKYKVVDRKRPPNNRSVCSSVWDTFQVVIHSVSGMEVGAARCKQCNGILVHRDNSGTSALKRHLGICPGSVQVVDADSRPKPTPTAVQKMKAVLINYCADDLRPFFSTAGQGFLNTLQVAVDIGASQGHVDVRDLVPDKSTLSRGLKDHAENERKLLMEEVKIAIRDKRCACTTDMWTDRFRKLHYITLTAHYINEIKDKLEMKNHVLFTVKFSYESATGINIRNELFQRLAAYGVTAQEFSQIDFVTDGGANIKKALEEHNREDCLAHLFNVTLQNSFSLKYHEVRATLCSKDDRVSEILTTITDSFRLIKTTPLRRAGMPAVTLKKLKKSLVLPAGKCASFVPMLRAFFSERQKINLALDKLERSDLQLNEDTAEEAHDMLLFFSPLDGKDTIPVRALPNLKAHCQVQNDDSDLIRGLRKFLQEELKVIDLFALIEKYKELVGYMRRSGHNAKLSFTLKQECETRWNSLLMLLDSLFKVYDEVEAILRINEDMNRMEGIEKDSVKELADFLRPFKSMTDKLQGEDYPTLPLALLAVTALREHCEPVSRDSSLIAAIRARTRSILQEKVKCSMKQKVAAFLWPSYRALSMLSENERDEVLKHVEDQCRTLKALESENVQADQSDESEPSGKRPRLDDDFSKWRVESPTETSEGEVKEYLRSTCRFDDSNLLECWQALTTRFPTLSKLAIRELGKPATSASSERAFSVAGVVLSARRCTLDPDGVDGIIFLHNLHLKSRKRSL